MLLTTALFLFHPTNTIPVLLIFRETQMVQIIHGCFQSLTLQMGLNIMAQVGIPKPKVNAMCDLLYHIGRILN